MPENIKMSKDQQLIAYLIQSQPGLSITSLMKLPYLIDLVAMKKLNRKITNISFKRYFYGPFSQTIYEIVEWLLENNLIEASVKYTIDNEYQVYSPTDLLTVDLSGFDQQEQDIINQSLDELGGYGAKILAQIAYATEPMKKLHATIGGNEHFNAALI